MAKLSAVLFAALALAQSALGGWETVSSSSEPGAVSGVEHRHLVLRDSVGDADATMDLALFSRASGTLRIVDNAAGSETLSEAMARTSSVAGVNGGYFDTNFKPMGLRVINGAVASPLARARLLSGVLCASGGGITIMRLREFSAHRRCESAMQCGPFLVENGVPVSHLNAKRSARRTFAAVTRRGKAAQGVSSELTLAQLAGILADRPLADDFATWRALNLDGGSSSAFWFHKKDGSVFSVSEEKNVRDFIGLTAK